MMTYEDWLALSDRRVSQIVEPKVSTAIIYLNGTRRWFLKRNRIIGMIIRG